MGARYLGLRSAAPTNDNRKRGLDEVPIRPEEWRHPPTIDAGPWFCLVTVPAGEYRCADALEDAGVTTYVPTETAWTVRMKGRERLKVQVQRTVFKGYLFARIAQSSDWSPIYDRDAFGRSRAGVIGVIAAGGAPVPIPAGKLRGIAADEAAGWFDDGRRPALIAGRDAKPLPAVMTGEVVRITGGPFSGHEGIAENDNERQSARISLGIFGQATVATINLDDLENLTRPAVAAGNLRRA